MKTLVILLITLFTTITSFASTGEPIASTIEGQTITVYFDNEKSETVNISIVDNAGFELLSEKVMTKNRKSRGYNLEQLPYGIYTIEMDYDQRVVYKTIKTGKNNSVVLNEKVTYKPVSFFQDDRWKLNLLALGEDVQIKIFDADYEPIFEDKIEDQKILAKTYNLSNLDFGVYTLSVTIGDNSYNKVIAKM